MTRLDTEQTIVFLICMYVAAVYMPVCVSVCVHVCGVCVCACACLQSID